MGKELYFSITGVAIIGYCLSSFLKTKRIQKFKDEVIEKKMNKRDLKYKYMRLSFCITEILSLIILIIILLYGRIKGIDKVVSSTSIINSLGLYSILFLLAGKSFYELVKNFKEKYEIVIEETKERGTSKYEK